jgi:hypothetical protein
VHTLEEGVSGLGDADEQADSPHQMLGALAVAEWAEVEHWEGGMSLEMSADRAAGAHSRGEGSVREMKVRRRALSRSRRPGRL